MALLPLVDAPGYSAAIFDEPAQAWDAHLQLILALSLARAPEQTTGPPNRIGGAFYMR
jgi:hypothetical protein